ncbi:hypothetical protein NUW58_g4548 [Xylaria curta]|uniref:Uncharacterized protein n=1 Tax=Xylaria curta TaxID=42375 RepID=A0ACC1P878_9PEZI|nr:hypothetical protein NUW58_g4548 [Xylaria curta]
MPSIRNRQDDGQIQALSAQLQSLSQSATEAISSVSSSASSAISQISRSADQATQSIRQSASQAADQANRQLSQTESSASSALSAVNARASDQISQSLASMSSRISVNLASAQSSASNAVSSARSAASQFAASKIQAFKAGASETRCDANPQAQQMEPNSVSASNAAIIITVSIIATAILSVASTCLFMRYRRKRMSSRGENTRGSKDRTYEKPVAVRGSLSPRFPRFGKGARAPADNFKLPSILPPVAQSRDIQSKAPNDIGFATIAYSDLEENRGANQAANDADDTQSSTKSNTLRFQKNKGVSSATAVRLIRVSSGKSRASFSADAPETATGFLPPLPIVSTPNQPLKAVSISAPYQPVTESPSQTGNTGTQPPKEKEPAFEGQPGSVEPIRTPETQVPGWRPPIPLTATGRDRFRFRDSSELESAEPTPTKTDTMPPPNTSTLSPRLPRSASLQRTNRGDFTRTMPTGQPKNGKGTFATFPRIRGEPSRVRSEPSRLGRPDLSELPASRGNVHQPPTQPSQCRRLPKACTLPTARRLQRRTAADGILEGTRLSQYTTVAYYASGDDKDLSSKQPRVTKEPPRVTCGWAELHASQFSPHEPTLLGVQESRMGSSHYYSTECSARIFGALHVLRPLLS